MHEIRLRAGQYNLQMTKDSKLAKQELISITRGGTQVVKVHLEGKAPSTPTPAEYQQSLKDSGQLPTAAPKAETGAFVVLGGAGVVERKFDTLAEAVQGASDGDVIEIRGNGPFIEGTIAITQPLTIRAGDGFRPVLRLTQTLQTNASLVLEGLELQRWGKEAHDRGYEDSLVFGSPGPHTLYLGNCHFQTSDRDRPCVTCISSECIIRNCKFLSPDSFGLFWSCRSRLELDNCLLAGVRNVELGQYETGQDDDMSIRIKHSTLLCADRGALGIHLHPELLPADKRVKSIRTDTTANVFDTRSVFVMGPFGLAPADIKFWSAEEAQHVCGVFWPGETT